jgi:hypothetical protein
MLQSWITVLRTSTLPALRAWPDPALAYFVQRDLLEEAAGPLDSLWRMPPTRRLLDQQQPDGSWRCQGRSLLANRFADGLRKIGPASGRNFQPMRHWVGLAICRVLKKPFAKEVSS